METLLKVKVLLLFVLWVTTGECRAEEFVARIVGVHDGDSITVLTQDESELKIRLEGIDAPELHQSFGKVAKQMLSKLVFGKNVRILDKGRDRYGRVLADIYDGDRWINLVLVEQGMAWVFLKYSRDAALLAAEKRARESRQGLWRDANPVAPWAWRRSRRSP